MRNLSNNLIEKKNALASADPWLVLLEINLSADTFYLVNNTEDIVFQGRTYTKANFLLDPPKQTSKGEIPSVKLQVANVNQALMPYLEEYAGGVGSTVKVTVVNAGLLAEDYAELEMTFDVMAASADAMWATFQLGAPNPLISRFPVFRYIATRCKWVLGYYAVPRWPECGYAGLLPNCTGTLEDCRLHDNSPRFGGYPGLAAGGIKIA